MNEPEMLKTFNSGIGMIAVVDAKQADHILNVLNDAGESATTIGVVNDSTELTYTGSLI